MTISAVSKFCLQQNSDPFVVLKFWATGLKLKEERERGGIPCLVAMGGVWPDLGKFHHFDKMLTVLRVYLVLGKFSSLL